MKLVSRIAVPAILLGIGLSAFGQDLSIYSKMGRLTPHVAGRAGQHSLLVYKSRGVVFRITERGMILSAMVFQPGLTPPAARSIGVNELVPGVGACGVVIGMPREQIHALPLKSRTEDINWALYYVNPNTKLLARFYAGKVTQLEVYSLFRTPEGITNSSTEAQILAIYGPPDQQFDFEMRKGFFQSLLAFLAIPILGLATGIIIRKARPSLVLAIVSGAVGLLIAQLVAAFGCSHLAGFEKDWHNISYGLADAVLVGAGSAWALELLSRRLSGCLGSMVTLAAMLSVALIAVLLVSAVEPVGSLGSPWARFVLFNSPYVVTLFLGAGTKRTH